MRSLIRFELRKLFQAKVLYICAVVIVFLIFLFAGINKLEEAAMAAAYEMYMSPGMDEVMPDPDGIYIDDEDVPSDFLDIMGMVQKSSGAALLLKALVNVYVIVVFAAFVAVFVCGDFGNGVIKNIITKGYTRTEVYFSKYLVCLMVCIGYAILAMLAGLIAGTVFWDIGSSWSFRSVLLILAELFAVAAYNALFCFLAALFKRVGPALAFSIAIPIILPTVLSLIELIAGDMDLSLSDHWISGCINLVSSPQASGGDIAMSFIASAVYIVIFTLCGLPLARKREV